VKQIYNPAEGKVKCPFDNQRSRYTSFDQIKRNYTLLEVLEAQETYLEANQGMLCPTHNKQLFIFFCETDSTFLCQFCLLNSGHLAHRLSDASLYALGKRAVGVLEAAQVGLQENHINEFEVIRSIRAMLSKVLETL
jgi:B-box zinc finger